MSRMGKRIVFGAILIAALAAVLWGDWRLEQWERKSVFESEEPSVRAFAPLLNLHIGIPTLVVLGALLVVGFFEFRRLVRSAGLDLLPVSGLFAVLALATAEYRYFGARWLAQKLPMSDLGPLALLLVLVFAEQMIRHRKDGALGRISATVFGVAYLGGCGSVILWIRLNYGVPTLALFLIAAKSTDIGAYFTGSFIGRHKLIPWLSPGKSWEGLLGGILTSAAVCAMIPLLLVNVWHVPFWADGHLQAFRAGVFGAVVGLAGQFGDLCESLLKRSAGLKDSGAVLPEFGGVLDIIDSVLLSAPVAAILLAVLR